MGRLDMLGRLAKYSTRELSALSSASSSLSSFSMRLVAKASSREKEIEAALPGEEQPAGVLGCEVGTGGTVVPGV